MLLMCCVIVISFRRYIMLCNFCKPLPVHIIIIHVYAFLIFGSSCSVIVHDTQYLSHNISGDEEQF